MDSIIYAVGVIALIMVALGIIMPEDQTK